MQDKLKTSLKNNPPTDVSPWKFWTSQLLSDGCNEFSLQINKHLTWLYAADQVPYSLDQAASDIRQCINSNPDQTVLSLRYMTSPDIAHVMITVLPEYPCRFNQLLHGHVDCDNYVQMLSTLITRPGNQIHTLSLNLGSSISMNSIRSLLKALADPNSRVISLQLNDIFEENINDEVLTILADVLENPNCKIARLDIGGWEEIFSPTDNLFADESKSNNIVEMLTGVTRCSCSRAALAAVGKGMMSSWQRYTQAYRQAVGEQKMTAIAAMKLAGLPSELIITIINAIPPHTSASYYNDLTNRTFYPTGENFRFLSSDNLTDRDESVDENQGATTSIIKK